MPLMPPVNEHEVSECTLVQDQRSHGLGDCCPYTVTSLPRRVHPAVCGTQHEDAQAGHGFDRHPHMHALPPFWSPAINCARLKRLTFSQASACQCLVTGLAWDHLFRAVSSAQAAHSNVYILLSLECLERPGAMTQRNRATGREAPHEREVKPAREGEQARIPRAWWLQCIATLIH